MENSAYSLSWANLPCATIHDVMLACFKHNNHLWSYSNNTEFHSRMIIPHTPLNSLASWPKPPVAMITWCPYNTCHLGTSVFGISLKSICLHDLQIFRWNSKFLDEAMEKSLHMTPFNTARLKGWSAVRTVRCNFITANFVQSLESEHLFGSIEN